jgi:hypothetical protein
MSLLTASSTFKNIPKTGKNTASKQNKIKNVNHAVVNSDPKIRSSSKVYNAFPLPFH